MVTSAATMDEGTIRGAFMVNTATR
jgi:hypothetical protein